MRVPWTARRSNQSILKEILGVLGREKRRTASQGPPYTLRDNGLCEEGLGPGESGELAIPQPLLSPHGHLGSRRNPGTPWLPVL